METSLGFWYRVTGATLSNPAHLRLSPRLRLRGRFLIAAQPIPRSEAASSGVPHTRQMTAEQSPQVNGSFTSRAHLGQ